jgi:hypothetical protein
MKTISFVDKVANIIFDLGLTAPAIFVLEAHKPLAFVGSQFLLIAQPTLDIFLPRNLIRETAELLADPDELEQLISRLEAGSLSTSLAKHKKDDHG